MQTILFTIATGIAATAIMSTILYGIHFTKLANADMVRAIGSLITKRKDNALRTGFVMHLIAGIMFAFPYCFVISTFPSDGFLIPVLIGAVIGFFHGFVFSFIMIAMVAEDHPLEEYRNAGISVAVAHIVGHIVYGVVSGLLVYLFQIHYGIRLAIQ